MFLGESPIENRVAYIVVNDQVMDTKYGTCGRAGEPGLGLLSPANLLQGPGNWPRKPK
jgi:hypothetical protein